MVENNYIYEKRIILRISVGAHKTNQQYQFILQPYLPNVYKIINFYSFIKALLNINKACKLVTNGKFIFN